MRRSLPALLLLAALTAGAAGCGDDDGDDARATDSPTSSASSASSPAAPSPAAPSPAAPSDEASQDAGVEVVELVTETAVGGEVGTTAVLTDPAEASPFLGQFGATTMVAELQQLLEATQVPEGMVPYAAVVSVGCDTPDDVRVSQGPGGLLVEAVPVSAPKQECLAAMTTVAFLLVPADAV